MKICRFNNHRLGLVQANEVRDVTAALEAIPPSTYPWPAGDALVVHFEQVRQRIEELAPSAPILDLGEVRLLSPTANPGKIIAAPVNYRKHIEEAREQAEINFNQQVMEIESVGLFLKASSSLVGASDGVAIEHLDRRNDHELELVAVIGAGGRNIRQCDALEHVLGYAIGLDMTVRGTQERSMRKSIDSYSVVGPYLVTADELADAGELEMRLAVNGEVRQTANTSDLLVGLPRLIEWASSYYTLYPGDLIYTGTPQGVGPVTPGDSIQAEIEGLGQMTVKVRGPDRSQLA